MLKNQLQSLIKGQILDDAISLQAHSRDASLFHVQPMLVVIPENVQDIEQVVQYVVGHPSDKLSLTVRSGGTDMTGGPLNESIIIDIQKLNHLKEIGTDYAVTEPGVYYRDFEKETLKHDLLMPSYPASREICTVGGMVANNSGGEKSLTYGKTQEYVAGLKVILRDGREYEIKPLDATALEQKMQQQDVEGECYRSLYHLIEKNYDFIHEHKPHVSKNSAGYALWNVWDRQTFDLTELFVGSQGTLGIITEIKFKLIHPKKHSKLLVIFIHDLAALSSVIPAVMTHKPESFESYDDKTLKLAVRFAPEMFKKMGANVLKLAWQFLPEFWMFLTGGTPKLILMAEFTGDSESEVDQKVRAAQVSIPDQNTHITHTESEAQKYWTIRRESFNLLRHHIKDKQTAPFIDDMVVRPEFLPQFLPRLEELMRPYNLTYSIAGHVGDGNFHIIPLMNLHDQHSVEVISELSKKVYNLILEFHGSITGEHNDGLIRTPYLKQMYGDRMYSLFEEVKRIFDPQNIFNPGKKVGASISYAIKHIQPKED